MLDIGLEGENARRVIMRMKCFSPHYAGHRPRRERQRIGLRALNSVLVLTMLDIGLEGGIQ